MSIPDTDSVLAADKKTKTKSTIQWPYYDLADAMNVAHAVYAISGGEAALDALARQLQHKTVDSGAFRLRLAGAAMFGLLDPTGRKVRLTERAKAIESQHPDDVQQALIDAFLAVPLFARVHEQYQGRQLPPEVGLKHVIRELGVTENQVDRAYSVLRRSATTAGFSSSGENYLVRPSMRIAPKPREESARDVESRPEAKPAYIEIKSGGGGAPPPTGIHPALMGLLQVLPAAGTPWPQGKREWLTAFTATINVLYPDYSMAKREEESPATE